jgi:hypothetical protein
MPVKTSEYINDFLFFVIRPEKRNGKDVLVCCSGVNVSLFNPIHRGRHGIGSSPVVRGLQLVNQEVRKLAISKDAIPVTIKGIHCAGIAPTMDTWYTEFLTIENAPESFAQEIIEYCVPGLLEKIFKATVRPLQLPAKLPNPRDLQTFLEKECGKYCGK